MKTPDEIKKGLREALHVKYFVDDPSSADGRDVRYGVVIGYFLRKEIVALIERLAQAERERDAAVHDLQEVCKRSCFCFGCKYQAEGANECMDCIRDCNWEWRGVCDENSKEN